MSRRRPLPAARLGAALHELSRRLTPLRARLADSAARAGFGRAARAAAKVGIVMVLVSTGLAAGAFAAWTLYGQYGAPQAHANALTWAERPLKYASTDCRDCHGGQAAAAAGAAHVSVLCEVCHVPTVAHPGSVAGVVQALPAPTSRLCVTCHARAAGRPAGFSQVDPSRHYPNAACLQCHDPHTAVAVSPPAVTHPLTRLPACTTCHAPGGLKRFPAGHQPAGDSVCLACHVSDRREQ